MPPKFDPNSPEAQELTALFVSVGLPQKAATDLVRRPKSAAPFKALIQDFQLTTRTSEIDEKKAAVLVKLSAGCGKLAQGEKGYAVEKILKGDIKTPDQISGWLTLSMQDYMTHVSCCQVS